MAQQSGGQERFDIEGRWPDLFEGLSTQQRWAVRQSLAAAWHEGWVPNREDVALATADERGQVSDEEFLRRARANATAQVTAERVPLGSSLPAVRASAS